MHIALAEVATSRIIGCIYSKLLSCCCRHLLCHIGLTSYKDVTIEHEGLSETRVAVDERILCHLGIVPVEILAICHREHVEVFLGRAITTPTHGLTFRSRHIDCEDVATYRDECLGGATVEVCRTESVTIVRRCHLFLLHQVVVAIGLESIEERLAGIHSQFPTILVIIAKPYHLLLSCFALGIRFVTVEERTGYKEQQACLQRISSSLAQAAVHLRLLVGRKSPREVRLCNSLVEQTNGEVDSLLKCGATRHLVGSIESMVDNGHCTIMTNHVGIIYCHHHLSLGLQTCLLVCTHVGHTIDVGYEQPSVADGRPHVGISFVEANLGLLLEVGTCVLGLGGVLAVIVNLLHT